MDRRPDLLDRDLRPETLSPAPEVRLVNAFERPFENAVATARTCYSGRGVVWPDEVSGGPGLAPDALRRRVESRDRIAKSIYQAGHHTTLQHSHFQFALDKVSRHFLWTFLHSHPFYNSEQVSQRYVEVKPENHVVPPLAGEALSVYLARLREQMEEYRGLIRLLVPLCEREYFARFRARAPRAEQYAKEVQKKAQEIARYVLPLATHAYLYHTVSGLTLLRYWRLCQSYDAPLEQRAVVGKMVALLLERDPLFETILEEPLPLEETPEAQFFAALSAGTSGEATRRASWASESARAFDEALGGRVSRLTDWKTRNEESVAEAVREIFGLPPSALSDDDAILAVLDPAKNGLFGETMNVSTMGKLPRALYHASYTFKKKLSHAADSQDQRHRMTPASRPCLPAYLSDAPDFILPPLVAQDDAVRAAYEASMARTWDALSRLRALGVPDEYRAYLLPNAVSIRFTESSDLLNLHHKLKMRLCWNAQEEIWRASRDEAMQVAEVNPRIGRWLLPPCTMRARAKSSPICPEGDRYCGVRVWTMSLEGWKRAI